MHLDAKSRQDYERWYGEFCKLLITSRINSGLTQNQLADLLKKPQSFVSKYESGERRLDVIEFLFIADHMDIDISLFLKQLRKNRTQE